MVESGTALPKALDDLGLSLTQYNKTRRRHPGFDARIRRAMRDDTHRMVYETLDISDGDGDDTRITMDGKEVADYGKINRDRLRVDTRLKVIRMLNPEDFGEKRELRVEGDIRLSASSILPDAKPVIQAEVVEREDGGILPKGLRDAFAGEREDDGDDERNKDGE